MKLTITKKAFKGRPVGTEIEVTERQAKLLAKLGRGQYMTRDMIAAPVSAPSAPCPAHAPAAPAPAPADPPADPPPPPSPRSVLVDGAMVPIDELDAETLHALAKKLEVKVHHASGAEKVRAALLESQAAAE